MTLNDVFQPNQYGTVPMIFITGVGTIKKTNELFATADISGREPVLLPLTTKVAVSLHGVVSLDGSLAKDYQYYMTVLYLVPFTAENHLIATTLSSSLRLYVVGSKYSNFTNLNERMLKYILPDGTGWVFGEPVTYYIEDILYRLDLQGNIT